MFAPFNIPVDHLYVFFGKKKSMHILFFKHTVFATELYEFLIYFGY